MARTDSRGPTRLAPLLVAGIGGLVALLVVVGAVGLPLTQTSLAGGAPCIPIPGDYCPCNSFEPGPVDPYPATGVAGGTNWYNYTLAACGPYSIVGDFYFAVGDEFCNITNAVSSARIFNSTESLSLTDNRTPGWWNVNDSSALPPPASPENLSIVAPISLANQTFFIYYEQPVGVFTFVYGHVMTPPPPNPGYICAPAPP
jgi:hypothetical protein